MTLKPLQKLWAWVMQRQLLGLISFIFLFRPAELAGLEVRGSTISVNKITQWATTVQDYAKRGTSHIARSISKNRVMGTSEHLFSNSTSATSATKKSHSPKPTPIQIHAKFKPHLREHGSKFTLESARLLACVCQPSSLKSSGLSLSDNPNLTSLSIKKTRTALDITVRVCMCSKINTEPPGS